MKALVCSLDLMFLQAPIGDKYQKNYISRINIRTRSSEVQNNVKNTGIVS